MKRLLIFGIIFAIVISLFLVYETVMIKNGSSMPNAIRLIFGVLFIIFATIAIAYLIGSKVFKYEMPEYISINVIEIIAIAVVAIIIGIVLIVKK